MRIYEATSQADILDAKRLFLAYAASLEIDLCFQNFEHELATLPGAYAPPAGCLLLAEFDGTAKGCVALRPLKQGTCEMKRLFIQPELRGQGAGRALAVAILAKATAIGYTTMRLDTLASMTSAVQLYTALGFHSIAPYYENPVPGALFFECKL